MAFLGETFNAKDLPEGGDYEVIPAGWYSAEITSAEVKETKSGTGEYIKLRFDITGPEYSWRVVFGNINIRNANPQAEAIARRQLGEIMRAIGLESISNTDQLVGGNLSIKVAIRAASDQYEAQNEVKGFKPLSGAMPVAAAKPAEKPSNLTPKTATTGGAAPPWGARK